jgi:hypothetical protein
MAEIQNGNYCRNTHRHLMPLLHRSVQVQQIRHDEVVAGVISVKLAKTTNRTFRHYG